MANHYKKIRNAKSVIDCSSPKGYNNYNNDCRTSRQSSSYRSTYNTSARSRASYSHSPKTECRPVCPVVHSGRSCSAPSRRRPCCPIQCTPTKHCQRPCERPKKLEPLIITGTNKDKPHPIPPPSPPPHNGQCKCPKSTPCSCSREKPRPCCCPRVFPEPCRCPKEFPVGCQCPKDIKGCECPKNMGNSCQCPKDIKGCECAKDIVSCKCSTKETKPCCCPEEPQNPCHCPKDQPSKSCECPKDQPNKPCECPKDQKNMCACPEIKPCPCPEKSDGEKVCPCPDPKAQICPCPKDKPSKPCSCPEGKVCKCPEKKPSNESNKSNPCDPCDPCPCPKPDNPCEPCPCPEPDNPCPGPKPDNPCEPDKPCRCQDDPCEPDNKCSCSNHELGPEPSCPCPKPKVIPCPDPSNPCDPEPCPKPNIPCGSSRSYSTPAPPPNSASSSNYSFEENKLKAFQCNVESREEMTINYCDDVEDHEYVHFLLSITEDILRNDMYTNSGIDKVIESHYEANKGRLDEQKMRDQIDRLKRELKCPLKSRPNSSKFIVCGCEEEVKKYECKKCKEHANKNCGCTTTSCRDTENNDNRSENQNCACQVGPGKKPSQNSGCRAIGDGSNPVEADNDNLAEDLAQQPTTTQGPDPFNSDKCLDPNICTTGPAIIELETNLAPDKTVTGGSTSVQPVAGKLNSTFKVVHPGMNTEKKVSHVAFYASENDDVCHCTISLKKTALKIETEGEEDQEYILVEGPVCIPMTMLKEKTIPVMIENLPSLYLDSDMPKEGSSDYPSSKVNLLVTENAADEDLGADSISGYIDLEYDQTPERDALNEIENQSVGSEVHLNGGPESPILECTSGPEDRDIPPSVQLSCDFRDKYHYLLKDAATSVSAFDYRTPAMPPKLPTIEEPEEPVPTPPPSIIKMPSPSPRSPSSSSGQSSGERLLPMDNYKKERSAEQLPLKQSRENIEPNIFNYPMHRTLSPDMATNDDESDTESEHTDVYRPQIRARNNADDDDYDHKDILRKLDEVPQVDSLDKRNNSAPKVTDKLREFRKIDDNGHTARFQTYMNSPDSFEIRRQSFENDNKIAENPKGKKKKSDKGGSKNNSCC